MVHLGGSNPWSSHYKCMGIKHLSNSRKGTDPERKGGFSRVKAQLALRKGLGFGHTAAAPDVRAHAMCCFICWSRGWDSTRNTHMCLCPREITTAVTSKFSHARGARVDPRHSTLAIPQVAGTEL